MKREQCDGFPLACYLAMPAMTILPAIVAGRYDEAC
jgi:hypothetical protein